MRRLAKRHGQRGLTLVEVLVSLAIFGVIATSCTVLLRLAINSDEVLSEVTQNMSEVHQARSLMKADLSQILNRPSRDQFGTEARAAMLGGAYDFGRMVQNDEGEVLLLSMTTNGRPNPGDIYPQTSLQYVEYRLAEDKIIRRVWLFPDRHEQTSSFDTVLFSSVSNVEISFLDGVRWLDQWQSRGGAFAPRAIELNFSHETLGDIRQVFFIEEGSS